MRNYFLTSAVAAVIAIANPMNAEAQMQVSVETDRAFVAIDLTTAEVLMQPQLGTLENTTAGIVYVPDFADGTDSFAFIADHAFLGVPVTFTGDVVDGAVKLKYSYSTKKDDDSNTNGTENADGTITVDDDSGTTVTGTIIQEPRTTIDFPEDTVVIGTDDSVDNDVAIIDSGEGSEIHTHDDVGSLDELREILEGYEDGSIPALVVVGHGAGGGVQLEGDGDNNLDGETLADPDNPNQEIIDLINEKLEEDAKIYILGCDQFDEDDAQHVQNLANETGHSVVANEDPVSFVTNPLLVGPLLWKRALG